MCDLLREELGRPLSPQEPSGYLGVDPDFVRKHYKFFGGIRPSERGRVLFFENLVAEAIRRASHGDENQETWENSLDGQSSKEWSDPTKDLQHQSQGTRSLSENLTPGTFSSFRRTLESRAYTVFWTPICAGVTGEANSRRL